ncbi:Mucin-5AC [Liparis tanakae]|uniref:Mucin-5AC n=1 Tax=Liparis tanakae TaxID=230148 RepID=A0A4Z2JAG2_9TELE|nr:Mucin-5AC [Liparis tanakae]
MNYTIEGCFCPDGMKLFNKESIVCVDKCGCLDPEGIAREFNERFEYKCQNCICEEYTKTVTCKPKTCPAPPMADCTDPGGSYESFNIQFQRQETNGSITIKKVTMKLDGVVVELAKTSIIINDKPVTIPFSQSGISIERAVSYVKIESKLGLVVMWNEKDSLWVELDSKFKNQTCGLCGDYNGVQLNDDFIKAGESVPLEYYGEIWKVNGPIEECEGMSTAASQTCDNQNTLVSALMQAVYHSNGRQHNCVAQWRCESRDCPGICSVLGGSHISTYDDKTYSFHGDCSYVLSTETSRAFTVVGNLAKCKDSEKSTCLSAVTLVLPTHKMIVVEANGKVLLNKLNTQLPLITVRSACVLPYPLMSMHVLLKVSY